MDLLSVSYLYGFARFIDHRSSMLTLPFPLADLESQLPDGDRLAGEGLLDAGRVGVLVETERHLWTARVADHEPEVQLTPSRVRALSCGCAAFRERGSCAHVAALLLRVRANRPAPKPNPSAGPKRLSIPAILQLADREELTNFLRDYAKRDKGFALALKARFAARVDLDDNREKYHQLIDGTLRTARKAGGTYSPRALKKTFPVLRELLGQADDAMARDSFADATDLLTAFIPRISQLLPRVPELEEALRELVSAAFARLSQLLERFPAPTLREILWRFGIEEIGKSRYRRGGVLEPLFALLLRLADEGEKRDALMAVLDEQLQRPFAVAAQRHALLSIKLDLLRRNGAADAVKQLLLENLDSPQLLTGMVRAELERQQPAAALELGEAGHARLQDRWAVNTLEDLLLRAAEQLGDTDRIERYGSSRFLTSYQFTYFDRLAGALSGSGWQARLEARLLAQPATARRTQALANWYARTEQPDALLRWLHTHPDLDLLEAHIGTLYAYSEKEAADLLRQFTRRYLDSHLGLVPARRIEQLLYALRQRGLPEVARRLAAFLRTTYPKRRSLRDVL